jgi:two-component system sensor histidine kinase YesM
VLQKIPRFYKSLTLRKRIVYLFSVAAFIPFLCTVVLSYNAIYSILENKLENSARSNLQQMELSLAYTLDNLAQVSQQFVYPSSIALKLNDLLETDDISQSTALNELVQSELEYISYTNANVGLTTYLDEDEVTLFRNVPIRKSFSFERLPVLSEQNGITYYGPHISNSRLHSQYVVSIKREVNLPSQKTVSLYMETSFSFTKSILEANQLAKNSFYLFLDEENRIVFSQLTSLFPVNEHFEDAVKGDTSGLSQGYYWLKTTSKQGWSIVSLIPKNEYNQEKNLWITQIIILAIIFGIFSLFIAWLVWKMIYKPIRQFDSEIVAVSKNNFDFTTASTDIPEFDELLVQLQNMKRQISELIREVESKEKKRADLEIEKLLHQINPHFLMNTLDTVRWLAVLNHQDEINQMVTSLNKLLYYNIKRSGEASTIEEELESLQQYCNLQEIRYHFTYTVKIKVDPELLKMSMPRFILQPLVENSISHGLADEGRIDVEINKVSDYLVISIHDNGKGLSDDEIQSLLSEASHNRKAGMGIGMNYVKSMLDSFYKKKASLNINSEKGKGTTVVLKIPIES